MRLLVVLASPPMTAGQRTRSRLATLRHVLHCDEVVAANLCTTPAADLPALSLAAAEPDGWWDARRTLEDEAGRADLVMAAWGLSALTGVARRLRTEQLAWLVAAAAECGHIDVLTVGGQPRHPSRWHQYVSDKHGRTSGGTFEQRLRQVLFTVPMSTIVGS